MRYGDNAVFNLKEFIMNVQTTKTTDDLMVNAELARAIGGKKAQIHLFAGKNGYRIRMLSRDGKWRTVNWHRKFFNHSVEKALGCEITREDDNSFRARVPGSRVSVLADSRELAVALVAAKVAPPSGLRVFFHRSEAQAAAA